MRLGFWMNETSGELRPAVEAYLYGSELTVADVATLRAYFRQWIAAPVWGPDDVVDRLRERVDDLTTREAITCWLDDAMAIGIDPL